MAVYPVAPTINTLANDVVGGMLKNYRDGGYTQATAIVRDVSRVKGSVNVDKVSRQFDMKTAVIVDASLAKATLATGDTLQALPLDAGDVIVSGSLRVIRVASAGGSATATVKLGTTSISAAIDLLTLGTTVVATSLPLNVGTSDDTVDLLLTGTTSPVFDALVELDIHVQPNRG